jgi:hypothetical protein
MVKLIGLYADRPGSGKSTVAQALQEQGFQLMPFAAPLKRMAKSLLLDLGFTEELALHALNVGKETPLHELGGKTPRQLMQTLGTDWGRGMIDEKLWDRCWLEQALEALATGGLVAVDDIRFESEARLIRDHGGALIKVVRPDGASEHSVAHTSEGNLSGWVFDAVLMNNSSIDALQTTAKRMVRELNPVIPEEMSYAF